GSGCRRARTPRETGRPGPGPVPYDRSPAPLSRLRLDPPRVGDTATAAQGVEGASERRPADEREHGIYAAPTGGEALRRRFDVVATAINDVGGSETAGEGGTLPSRWHGTRT